MPSAFHDVQFPPDISRGAVGGPGFKTTILTRASGFEQRNQDWEKARGKYTVGHGVKTRAQLQALRDFFYNRRGRVHAFRMKDWLDFQLPDWTTVPGDLHALPTLFT